MLDFNHRPKVHEQVCAQVDAALVAEREQQPARRYLGGSRLGVDCIRALQYEYCQIPVDPGRETPGRVLRIFEVGHVLEDLAIRWLRLAGFDLYTRKRDGGQFGFSVANGRIQGHVDGVIANAPPSLELTFPMLWECKTMNDKQWRDTVKRGVVVAKPIYAGQIATYQAYMEPSIPGISSSPALFTAINKTHRSCGSSACPLMRVWPNVCPIVLCRSFRLPKQAKPSRVLRHRRHFLPVKPVPGKTSAGSPNDSND